MYPSIDIRTHTHIHTVTHKLFVHYTVTSLFFLRNQTVETIICSIRSLLSDIHIFPFLSTRIHPLILRHLPAKKRKKKKVSYVLMITMMIYMFYTLLPLAKFNNEIYSSMPTIGEIEVRGESRE